MSKIQFLASSKPFQIPREIAGNRGFLFEKGVSFCVHDLDAYWIEIMEPFFTMPYLYEARGLGNSEFWRYIEQYMEAGRTFPPDISLRVWDYNYSKILEGDRILPSSQREPSNYPAREGDKK